MVKLNRDVTIGIKLPIATKKVNDISTFKGAYWCKTEKVDAKKVIKHLPKVKEVKRVL